MTKDRSRNQKSIMNKSVKNKWLKALRSGEYTQGHFRLVTNDDKFCCLGVLCDLAVRAGITEWEKSKTGWCVDKNVSYLPNSVMNWSGLERDPVSDGSALSDLNDSYFLSFANIADIIEDQL